MPDCRPAVTVVAGVVKVTLAAMLAVTVSVCVLDSLLAASVAVRVGAPTVVSA